MFSPDNFCSPSTFPQEVLQDSKSAATPLTFTLQTVKDKIFLMRYFIKRLEMEYFYSLINFSLNLA